MMKKTNNKDQVPSVEYLEDKYDFDNNDRIDLLEIAPPSSPSLPVPSSSTSTPPEQHDATTTTTTTTTSTSEYSADDIGFVMVMDTRTHDTMKFGYSSTTTLAQLKQRIRRDLFHQKVLPPSAAAGATLTSSSLQEDGTLQLIWLGKELKPGCSWHTGVLDDDEYVYMKDLDFHNSSSGITSPVTNNNNNRDRPVIHAHFIAPLSMQGNIFEHDQEPFQYDDHHYEDQHSYEILNDEEQEQK